MRPSPNNIGHLFDRLRRMHEMQTIVIDDRGVCLSACLLQSSTWLHCAGSFGAASAKSLRPLVL